MLCLLLILLSAWHVSRQPSADRTWSIDQRILPYATWNDTEVTISNIRNFSYTSVSEYTPAYYDKTFTLTDLVSVDYLVEPFGDIGAAHTFLSFGFKNGDQLVISVEIRKEVGESFSPLKGMFRNYELMYVIADERDVIELRANHRKHDVYLYPIRTSQAHIQQLFTSMLARANTLHEKPEFYNTLVSNCTTNIVDHINEITPKKIAWDIRLLLPEHSDELVYELGLIDNSLPLNALRAQHKINTRALMYTGHPDFSKLIRQY